MRALMLAALALPFVPPAHAEVFSAPVASSSDVAALQTKSSASVLAYQRVTPASGATIVMAGNVAVLTIYGSAVLALLTVRLPPNPIDGQLVRLSSQIAVTTLIVQDAVGNAVSTGMSLVGLSPGGLYQFQGSAWVRIA